METRGAISNKPLEKIKRCEGLNEKDSKTECMPWDGTMDSVTSKECPLDGFVENSETEFKPISNIEEVFRDPSTFDFLSQIGSSNPLRDLRKESLYVKFDPCLQPPNDETSATDSNPPKRKVFPISNLVTSPCDQDTKLVYLKDEFTLPDLCLIEPLETSTIQKNLDEDSISKTKSSNNITLVDIGNSDSYIEKKSSLEQELRDLRLLLVKRAIAHRETKNNLETSLQKCGEQKLMQDIAIREGLSDLNRAIIAEYEDHIHNLKLENSNAAIVFKENKERLLESIRRVKEHHDMTDRAYADLSLKLYNTEKSINLVTHEIELHKDELKNIDFLTEKVEKNMAFQGWEFSQMVDRAFVEVEITKQNQKKELDLLETRIKTLNVKLKAFNERLAQLTAENQSFTAMLDEATKGQKL